MISSNTLYLIINGYEITIYNIDSTYTIIESFEKLIEPLLMLDLTTLKGRMDSIKTKYSFRKHVPIYIHDTLVFFTTKSKKSIDNIYINAYNIEKISRHNNGSKIKFVNGITIESESSLHLLMRYYKRALMIEK